MTEHFSLSIEAELLMDMSKCCASNDFYRKMIRGYIEKHDYDSAVYWAEKVVSLSDEQDQDIYTLAQCYFYSEQYQRGANFLIGKNYDRSNLYFRCLTAKCLYAAKEFAKALQILDLTDKNSVPGQKQRQVSWEPPDASAQSIEGQICLLRGKVHEALMNRILAAQSYKQALTHDIYCFEAFQLLTQHQILSRAEEVEFFETLPFYRECRNRDVEFVKYLYSICIKKYSHVTTGLNPVQFVTMQKNLDVLTGDAERLYYNSDVHLAYNLCNKIISEDPFHVGCLPVYIACLAELKKVTELFRVSHKLVETIPNTALAWFGVGTYYYVIGKHDMARRNLNKVMSIDQVFGPAWLLFGHSFAQEGEHDQAMAAYFKATQLMKGCHLPLLHVGMECGISNNPQLAMKFLEEALTLAPRDPSVRHEMGVIKFHERRFVEAHKHFMDTLELVENPNVKWTSKKWEALYNNLGHVCRKLKRYQDAFTYHRKALLLKPGNASNHAALGLLHAITGKTTSAIEDFHKSLSLQRDDAFSNTMLRYVTDKMVDEASTDPSDIIISPPIEKLPRYGKKQNKIVDDDESSSEPASPLAPIYEESSTEEVTYPKFPNPIERDEVVMENSEDEQSRSSSMNSLTAGETSQDNIVGFYDITEMDDGNIGLSDEFETYQARMAMLMRDEIPSP